MTTVQKKQAAPAGDAMRFVPRPLTQEEQIDRNIANMERIAGSDKKQVVEFLQRAGILNKAGKLQAAP